MSRALPRTSHAHAPHPLSLRGLLAAQPATTLARLAQRRRFAVDPHKALDPLEQIARALAFLPGAASSASLAPATREALEALMVARGLADRRTLGGEALTLVELGLGFAAPTTLASDAIALPAAYRLQLPSPRGESRHAARRLLASLDAEARSDAIVALSGRRTSAPWPLALEGVLLRIETPTSLAALVSEQDREATLVLSTIEARGGEVLVDEYLDLCREPARWTRARIPRRGVAHHLASLALVVASGDGRVMMPEEVAAVVGRARRGALARKRRAALGALERRDDEPARATLASALGPRALAAWLAAEVAGRAPTRTAIARAARSTARGFEETALLVSLVEATPMRGHALRSYERALRATWARGRAWDELLESPRSAQSDDDTPILVLRACVLDALVALPRGRFAPRSVARATIESDPRFAGIRAAFERARAPRHAPRVATIEHALERLLDVSLPALGLLDVARDGSVRASARGLEEDAPLDAAPAPPRWESAMRARLDAHTSLDLVLGASALADGIADGEDLVLVLDPAEVRLDVRAEVLATLERAQHPDVAHFESLCPLPRARASAQRVAWLVTLPEPELARELRALPELARWLVAPHPDAALLAFIDGTPLGRLTRVLSAHGVALEPRTSVEAAGRRSKPRILR